MLKKVKMLNTAAGPEGTFTAGGTWTMDGKLADAFIAAGVAVLIEEPKSVPEKKLSEPESASIKQPETADMQAAKPRKGK